MTQSTSYHFSFTKEHTSCIKGLAIFFMLFYHLTGSPGRLTQITQLIPSWYGTSITHAFQICVPLFLFMGGFGLYKTYSKKTSFSYRDALKRIFNLYKQYWIIFFIFVPIGFLFIDYTFHPLEFISNLLAITSSYNGEWWFLSLYIELLLLFPIVIRINVNLKYHLLIFLGIFLITRFLLQIDIWDNDNILIYHSRAFLINLPIWMLGIIFAKFNIFQLIISKIQDLRLNNILIAFFCLAIPLLGRAYLPMIGVTEIVLVPVEIIGIIILCEKMNYAKSILYQLGKHSTNMWLIHSFFIFY